MADTNSSFAFMTAEQAAQMLGYSVHSIRNKARKKELPAHRIGRKWLFDAQELANFTTGIQEQDRLTI